MATQLWIRLKPDYLDGRQQIDAVLRIQASDSEVLSEMAEELTGVGATSQAVVLTSGIEVLPVIEVVLGGAGLSGLAAALRAWVRRNDGKRVRIEFNDRVVDLHGLSEDEVHSVLGDLSQLPLLDDVRTIGETGPTSTGVEEIDEPRSGRPGV